MKYDVPIGLFIFKRPDLLKQILDVLKVLEPTKIYAFSDWGRTKQEIRMVEECRELINSSITWNCKVESL